MSCYVNQIDWNYDIMSTQAVIQEQKERVSYTVYGEKYVWKEVYLQKEPNSSTCQHGNKKVTKTSRFMSLEMAVYLKT